MTSPASSKTLWFFAAFIQPLIRRVQNCSTLICWPSIHYRQRCVIPYMGLGCFDGASRELQKPCTRLYYRWPISCHSQGFFNSLPRKQTSGVCFARARSSLRGNKEGEAGCFVETSDAPEAPEAWAIDADGTWVMGADVGVSAGGLWFVTLRCLHKPSSPSQAFFPCFLTPPESTS